VTHPIVRVTVVASSTEGDLDVTATQPVAQRLRAIFDTDATSSQPFEGTGCSDHVRRRSLTAPVAVAAVLLVVLIALLVL